MTKELKLITFYSSLFFVLLMSSCQSRSSYQSRSSLSSEFAKIEVSEHQDLTPVGSAYKVEEWVFESKVGDCVLTWHASVPQSEPSTLNINTSERNIKENEWNCVSTFQEKSSTYKAILKRVRSHFPKHDFKILHLSHQDFANMSDQIIAAAKTSPAWNDYLKRRKKNKFLHGNTEFVVVFNQADLASHWREIFRTQGMDLQLDRVEKVFMKDQKYPTNAGIYQFGIKPLSN